MITELRGLPRRERLLLGLALVALVAGVLARPVASLASRDVAAWLASPLSDEDLPDPDRWRGEHVAGRGVLHDALVDPWGRPWRVEFSQVSLPGVFFVPPQPRLYSIGADGRDEQGVGDDVVVRARPDLVWLRFAPLLGAGAACLLVWSWVVLRAVRAPRGADALLEAWRAFQVASLPIALATTLIFHDPRRLAGLQEVVGAQRVFVPLPVAASLTVAFLLWLAALRLRLRRPREEPEAPAPTPTGLRPRALAALLVLALGSVVAAAGWALRERGAAGRRGLLALACMPDGSAQPLLALGDPELVRSFARGAPPWVDFTHLDDASYRALSAIGPDANDAMARALEDRPRSPVQRGQPSTPWEHLRAHDPRLETLMVHVAARPEDFEGFLLDHAVLAASRLGRRAVGEVLVGLLDDTSSAGSSFNGYGVRMCDHALEALVGLFPEAALDKPAWNEQTGTRWDEAIAGARRWAAERLPAVGPAGVVVLDVREVTLRAGRATVDVVGEGLAWSSSSDRPAHLLARVVSAPVALRVVDRATSRAVDVPLVSEPGQTAWVEVDLGAGTATTTIFTPPP